MPLASTAFCNQALDSGTGGATNLMAYVGMCTASPGTTGANEVSGGGYSRQACTWNAAASGSKTNSSTLTFTTSGVTPITHFLTNSASTAGSYGIGGALASSVTATTITVAAGALTANAA